MRKWIDLFEKVIQLDTDNGDGLVVQMSPTRSDLSAFVRNQTIVRGLIGAKSFFWNAYQDEHFTVIDALRSQGIDDSSNHVPVVVAADLDTLKENDDWDYEPTDPYVFMQSGDIFFTIVESHLRESGVSRYFPDARIVLRIAISNGQQTLQPVSDNDA